MLGRKADSVLKCQLIFKLQLNNEMFQLCLLLHVKHHCLVHFLIVDYVW